MHASHIGEHLSGAEQLVSFAELQTQAVALLQRALGHERGCADTVHITIDPVAHSELVLGRLPALANRICDGVAPARQLAVRLLETAGVDCIAARTAIEALACGAAPGQRVMRGAMLIDASSGVRLEADQARGVRVSRLGIAAQLRSELEVIVSEAGLEAARVSEALVLAAKVQYCPDIVAELCWSDDPSYLSGYVAAQQTYTRLTPLKATGDPRGGRAFFVRPGADLGALTSYLEHSPFLVTDLGTVAEDIRIFSRA